MKLWSIDNHKKKFYAVMFTSGFIEELNLSVKLPRSEKNLIDTLSYRDWFVIKHWLSEFAIELDGPYSVWFRSLSTKFRFSSVQQKYRVQSFLKLNQAILHAKRNRTDLQMR